MSKATPSSAATPPAASTAAPTAAPAAASCRLPVASGDAPVDGRPADGTAGHGGFLTFPAGTFAADPASMGSYDRARARWLPVFRAWVSPDGTKYAWGEYSSAPGPTTGTIHVVDVASAADHPVLVPAASLPISYEAEGIYVARVIPNSGAPTQGVTLVDPTGAGSSHQVIADGSWTQIGGGFAFGADLDSSIPGPGGGGGPGAANRVRRLDLHTGAVSVVSTSPSAQSTVLGVLGSTPVISITTASSYRVVVGSTTIVTGPPADGNPQGSMVADGGTIWFGSLSGNVWRWDGSGSAARVATVPFTGVQIAGACR